MSGSFNLIQKNIHTVVILIGYQYHFKGISAKNANKLPGTLIDLYQAYKFCLDINPSRLEIITDIEHDHNWREIVGALGKNIVNSDILDFVVKIRQKSIYHRHRDKNWLINKLKEFSYKADRLLVYYTGHGNDGYLELPEEITEYKALGIESGVTIINSDHKTEYASKYYNRIPINKEQKNLQHLYLPMNDLRKLCFDQANPSVEALFILDCCNSIGLNFPYVLHQNGIYRLADKIPQDILVYSDLSTLVNIFELGTQLRCSQNNCFNQCSIKKSKSSNIFQSVSQSREFFTAHAICISSTNVRQDSISTSNGSLFTQQLFTYLSQGITSLNIVRQLITDSSIKSNVNQTTTIHSTYPHLHHLWQWVYGREKKYRINFDQENNIIKLQPISNIYHS